MLNLFARKGLLRYAPSTSRRWWNSRVQADDKFADVRLRSFERSLRRAVVSHYPGGFPENGGHKSHSPLCAAASSAGQLPRVLLPCRTSITVRIYTIHVCTVTLSSENSSCKALWPALTYTRWADEHKTSLFRDRCDGRQVGILCASRIYTRPTRIYRPPPLH